ncbi:thiolase family protein [Candidatus Methanomassiliicoccus intestinalis]|jgi:acetyl-coA C-acetyltransferase|uniref:3-ketoacyl-CoA thiolase / Acetyl-CoA acetyltransferase n=2 Tax=Candidatus Methanomassiliicoccus intestinalis TaxID=1406512 RepID=R9T948_METII|nr:thiolase family protein [Candidatus Methanomassiliicoccus intestinalis]AGN27215.1 3-ketoacyl-CoA thiolase / Acetyl- CoA acetyltransferase [Candidatus Methanomassiliicoccus intestinalis Issoire-Mx1]TQS81719.1 MAG: acetyl-CoA acetyltransferase [Candidatus Methanomassiliicoccus intestinalis]TQS84338.1 MAG: acetyl-CoA acetyltransferase [Candidatus Methanomassiliicoccus intestinalis]
MNEAVIVGATRTAVGKLGGALKSFTAPQLGAKVISEAVQRSKLEPADIQECIMGIVLSAGTGQNPARQAALNAGLPVEIGSLNVNKICGSGLKSVMLAANSVRVGEHEAIVAGGMESMSSAPYLLMDGRFGYRLGDNKIVDHLVHDGLWDAPTDAHMGMTAEIVAERFNVTREQADELSFQSHVKSNNATKNGYFSKEILPLTVKSKKTEFEFKEDEGIRPDISMEALSKLRPAFKKDGIVTAGNSSQISDGAAALVITSRKYAEEKSLNILASIRDYNTGGTKPEWIMEAPISTTQTLLKRNDMTIDDIDLFEHNEAFATASVAVKKTLEVPDEKFNVNGGAVAIGHPIGCSGARVLVSLIYELQRAQKHRGLLTLCLGGGNAVSMIIERE